MRYNGENEQMMAEAILEHYLETGGPCTREDIAKACGKTAATVGKWLRDLRTMRLRAPGGCRLEIRSRRGGGGGPGKEYFFPHLDTLRQVILEDRAARE